jgi:hypothetical protein
MVSTEYFLGRRSVFNYAVENVAYGTKNTATTYAWPGLVQKFTDSDAQTLEPLNPMDGVDVNTVGEYYPMVPKFGGTMEMLVQHMRFPMLCMGMTDTMTGSADPYTHTFAQADVMQSMSFQAGHLHNTTDFGKEYTGIMCNKGDFVFTKGDWMRYNADFVAQNAVKITSYKSYQAAASGLKKYTSANIRPYKSSDITLKVNDVDISPYITQARLGFDNQLQVDESMDTAVGELIAQPAPQVKLWDAGITVKMSNASIWDLFKAGSTVSNCSVKVTNGTHSITWTLSGVKVEKASEPIDITQGIVIQDVALKVTSVVIVDVAETSVDYDDVCA